MVRFFLSASLGLALFSVGACRPASTGVEPVLDPKAGDGLVVKLRFPGDAKFAEIHEIGEKVMAKGATKWSLQGSDAGEGTWAEVVAQPPTPSQRIAAVVGELLDCGITKISVEVKK